MNTLANFLLRLVGLMSFCFFVGACTFVTIEKGDGDIETVRGLGVLNIEMSPGTSAQSLSLKGAGIVRTPSATSIGVHRGKLVAIPGGCHVVLIDSDSEAVDALDTLLEGEDPCVVSSD